MKTRWFTTEPKRPEYYGGLLIHADTGLHEQMARWVRDGLPKGARILDLGAGAGAFTRRLMDLGYEVTPIDSDPVKWTLPDVELREVDLNAGVPADLAGTFDGVVAMEVIEHLENPWQLFRQAAELLRPGGLLFLSTPNVASFYSRLIFLRHGRFHQFDRADLEYGHINPITSFELAAIVEKLGWKWPVHQPGGYLPIFDFSVRSPRAFVANIARGMAYMVAKGAKRGWCTICVFERP